MNAPLVDTRKSPHARLRPVGVRDVTLTRGLLQERQAVVSRASIPAGWHQRGLKLRGIDGGVRPKRTAAGKSLAGREH